MTWQPLPSGDLARRAGQAVNAIAAALEEPPADARGFSLSTGLTGVALFFAYLSMARSDERFAELAVSHLSKAFDRVAMETSPSLGLFSGLSGVAWAWQHIERLLYGESSSSSTEDLDGILLEAVGVRPWQWEWDLVSGLAGIGLYALDHPERGFAQAATERIVDQLSDLAIECPEGIAWKTEPALMTPRNANKYPEGRFDQGVAHGVPGVVGFLGTACQKNLASEKARDLLDRSV